MPIHIHIHYKRELFVRVFRNKPHVFSVQGMKEAIRFFSVEAFCLASIGFSFKNQMLKGMVAHDFPPTRISQFYYIFLDKNYCWRLIFLSANGALFTVFSWLLGGALNEYASTLSSELKRDQTSHLKECPPRPDARCPTWVLLKTAM